MPGGWTPATPGQAGLRPGAYLNFQAAATAAISAGAIGTVAVVGIADWGTDEVVVELNSEAEILAAFADTDSAAATLYRMAREAFIGGANKVLAFRMLGANAVKGTRTLVDTAGGPANVIRIDAKYYGAYGNGFSLTIADNASDATKTDIKLYRGSTLYATWTTSVNHGAAGFVDNVISIINDDSANIWVTAVKIDNGNNDLVDISAQALASGANGDAVVAGDHTAAMDALQVKQWNVIAVETVNGSIQASYQSWLSGLRDDEGFKVMGVFGADLADAVADAITSAAVFDNESSVFVYPGTVMPNALGVSTTYSGAQMTSRVAGMIGGLSIGQSMTRKTIGAATDVEITLVPSDISLLLAGGVMSLVWRNNKVVVEQGLTTLTTVGTKPISFKKISVVRTTDAIANAIEVTAEDSYIGQVPNDAAGQRSLVNAVSDYLDSLTKSRAIQPGFSVAIDPNYDSSGDQVFLLIGMTPVDVMEFMFFTVTIN